MNGHINDAVGGIVLCRVRTQQVRGLLLCEMGMESPSPRLNELCLGNEELGHSRRPLASSCVRAV